MEPLLLGDGSRHRSRLSDLALELSAASAGFRSSLPAGVSQGLAGLVRAMNCYYSNLIEGHDTHPVDIERALRNDYSADARKRNLQREAKAHVTVQAWIDQGALAGKAMTADAIREVHRRFGELLPPELLTVTNPDTGEVIEVVPGELRHQDVKVGAHVPVSPGAVPRFLERFADIYGRLGRAETILSAAAAHHRLLWIHPFLDGNGRVARLMSHAVLLEALDTGGVWSVARGLARAQAEYKAHLRNCDGPRRNDLDGRGSLSEEALVEFTTFFLETCLDQVRFMESLMQPARLRDRILIWTEEEVRAGALPQKAGPLLEAVLYRGVLPRGDVPTVLSTSERSARRVVSALIGRGVLVSESTRAPVMLAFPAALAARWMPGLFPEQPS
ncbi:MAG: Fic family protein [Vicinamibacterales bacterium]